MIHMISKLELYVKCVEQISKAPDSAAKEKFYPILVNQVKTFLKHLSEIQTREFSAKSCQPSQVRKVYLPTSMSRIVS